MSPSVGTVVGTVVGSSTSGALAIVITRLAPGVTSEEAALLCFNIVPSAAEVVSWYFISSFNSCLLTNSSILAIVYPFVKSGYLYSTFGIYILTGLPSLLFHQQQVQS